MLRCQSIIILSLWITINSCSALQLPTSFKRCKVLPELDDKPNECLAKAITEAIPILSTGIKELGALPLDPLKIIDMTIEQGGSSPVAIKLQFTNCDFTGSKDVKVKELGGKLSSLDGFHMVIRITAPALTITGPYKISGKVLILPIEGVGQSKITLHDSDYEVNIKGEKQIKNGAEYLKITSVKLRVIDPKNMSLHFGNLFKGDKALGDNTNLFLNENWKDIFQELKGSIENAFGAVFEAYSKRILERIAFKDIFITE